MNEGRIFRALINEDEVAARIAQDKHELFQAIRTSVAGAVRAIEPRACLSFRLLRGDEVVRTVRLASSVEYARVLVAYLRGATCDGLTIDSAVTPIAMKATEDAIVEFYTANDRKQILAEEICRQLSNSRIVQAAMAGQLHENEEWLRRELQTILAGEAAHSMAGSVLDRLTDQIATFFSSAKGKSLLAAVSKVMATTAGQALMHQLGVAVAKALSSTALKSTLVAVIKKIGVGILVKTAVGKAVLALLAAVGISGIPLLWIILPIIAGFLAYEYLSFPEKLAEKLPGAVSTGIEEHYLELNRSVVSELLATVADAIATGFTEIREHDPRGEADAA